MTSESTRLEFASYFKKATLLYDGFCPMCTTGVHWLQRLHLDDTVQVISWQEAVEKEPALEQTEQAEWIRSEMLLVLPEEQRIVRGPAVFGTLLSLKPSTRWLGKLLQMQPAQRATGWLYETIALNRRVLTPPKQPQLACACDPPANRRVQMRFYIVLLTISLLGLIAFSGAVAVNYQQRTFPIVLHLLVAMAGGWLLAYTGLWILLRNRFVEALQQSVVIMTIGGLWLLFSAALIALGPFGTVAGITAPISFLIVWTLNLHTAVMMFSTVRRSIALHFPPILPWLWLALYFGGYLFLMGRLA